MTQEFRKFELEAPWESFPAQARRNLPEEIPLLADEKVEKIEGDKEKQTFYAKRLIFKNVDKLLNELVGTGC